MRFLHAIRQEPMNEKNRQKREIILDAAIKVFAEKGYHSSRTTDISNEAGVAYGSLYHYFQSKDDILLSIFRERWQLLLDKVKKIREALTEPGEKILTIIDYIFRSYITDRKKDIIITAGGKNTAPQKIETLFKENPLFTQFVVFGDRKKYLVALMNLDLDIAAKMAEKNGIKFDKPQDLLENPAFLKVLDAVVAEKNNHLAQYETIKYYRVLKDDFSKDTGELTLTLKLKRKVVAEKYKDLIESMYKES
jgi:AcrR family transcriptional regulator